MAGVDVKSAIISRARALGFDTIGVTRAHLPALAENNLRKYLAAGHHGKMVWMRARADARADPKNLWPQAVSVLSLGISYAPADDPLANLAETSVGNISVYARGRDYHEVIKGKLKHLGQFIAARGAEVKVFVDTAPVMEKPLAMQAGLGWQGKHTNLVSRTHGSWLFLGEIFTTLEITPDAAHADHCGSCTSCISACPTNAFPAAYQLDARRCISYLTIEHDGLIAEEFHAAIGNRIYGCDDCLAACPWNKFAQAGREQKFFHRDALMAPKLAELALLDDVQFRKFFSASPVKRIGRGRFLRNVAIAIGNSGDASLIPTVQNLMREDNNMISKTAAFSFKKLKNN